MVRSQTLIQTIVVSGAALVSIVLAPNASAQFRGGGPGGLMGNSPLSIINDANVVAELELVDDQVEQLSELQDEMRNVFRDSFSGMRDRFREKDVDREALMEEIREKIQTEMDGVSEGLNEILLPHQVTRLKELSLQAEVKRGGTQGLLSNPKVKEQLGLTDQQITSIQEKAESVKVDLEKKIEALRESAREEVLSVLTSEQQSKIKEMLGDSFEFEQRGGGRGRGGAGGRGNRGGGRGGFGGGRGGPGRGGPGGGGPDRGGRPDRP